MINTTEERPTFVTHLECGQQGDHYPADQLHGLSDAGKPLLVRYDLPSLAQSVSKEDLIVTTGRPVALSGNSCRFATLKILSAWARR